MDSIVPVLCIPLINQVMIWVLSEGFLPDCGNREIKWPVPAPARLRRIILEQFDLAFPFLGTQAQSRLESASLCLRTWRSASTSSPPLVSARKLTNRLKPVRVSLLKDSGR